jgi:hypothetical protein
VWCISRDIDSFPRPGNEALASETELNLTVQDGEHFFKVVAMWRGTSARRDVHVDEGVSAGGVVAGHQDRIGITDEPDVAKRLVFVGPGDRQVAVRVIGRYRRLRGSGAVFFGH